MRARVHQEHLALTFITSSPTLNYGPGFGRPSETSSFCFQQQADSFCSGQVGIRPLFLFLSAIVRRLWLDTRLLLASFLRRSNIVSMVWPWPLGLPSTLLGRADRKLEDREEMCYRRMTSWVERGFFLCRLANTEFTNTNAILNVPLPVLCGSSSSFSSFSQQSWVLHKLVPVYIILKQKQWIRNDVQLWKDWRRDFSLMTSVLV